MGDPTTPDPAEAEHTAPAPLLLCAHCGAVMPPGLGGGRGRKRFCSDRHRVAFHRTMKAEAAADGVQVLTELLQAIDQLRARVSGTLDRITRL